MALGLIQAGQRITASLLNSIAPLEIIKGADQSLLNSTTLQNDNALAVPVIAGATYDFNAYLNYEGSATGAGDLKFNWAIPVGANLRYTYQGVSTSGLAVVSGQTVRATTAIGVGTNGAAVLMGVDMDGTLIVGSAGGSLQLQWAQNTANNTTPTIVHSQSKLKLIRNS